MAASRQQLSHLTCQSTPSAPLLGTQATRSALIGTAPLTWGAPSVAAGPKGGRRIVLVIIGTITAGSVAHQTRNLVPQRFLISYPAPTAMPTSGFPARCAPQVANCSRHRSPLWLPRSAPRTARDPCRLLAGLVGSSSTGATGGRAGGVPPAQPGPLPSGRAAWPVSRRRKGPPRHPSFPGSFRAVRPARSQRRRTPYARAATANARHSWTGTGAGTMTATPATTAVSGQVRASSKSMPASMLTATRRAPRPAVCRPCLRHRPGARGSVATAALSVGCDRTPWDQDAMSMGAATCAALLKDKAQSSRLGTILPAD